MYSNVSSFRVIHLGAIGAVLMCAIIVITAPLLHPVLRVAPAREHIYAWQLADITQMHGLGLSRDLKRIFLALYIISAVLIYAFVVGSIVKIQQVTWIPVLDYGVVFALCILYLGGSALWGGFERLRSPALPKPAENQS